MTDTSFSSAPNNIQPQSIPNYPSSRGHNSNSKTALIVIIILGVFFVLLSALSLWLFLNYSEQKRDVDGKIATAVTEAKKQQADEYEADFAEREKNPNLEFTGPEDYGSVSFMYPKTWSVYVENDGSSGGDYQAYFNPKLVPSVKDKTQLFALRVKIEQTAYEEVVGDYDSQVEDGDLKSSSVTVNDFKGTRFDGNFSDNLRGSVVIFKIRDKTLSISTDANVFISDFDKLIQTIKFIQ